MTETPVRIFAAGCRSLTPPHIMFRATNLGLHLLASRPLCPSCMCRGQSTRYLPAWAIKWHPQRPMHRLPVSGALQESRPALYVVHGCALAACVRVTPSGLNMVVVGGAQQYYPGMMQSPSVGQVKQGESVTPGPGMWLDTCVTAARYLLLPLTVMCCTDIGW